MSKTVYRVAQDHIDAANADLAPALERDYRHLGEQVSRRGVDIDRVRDRVGGFAVALPTWGVGTGGTRFARFPMDGEPRSVFEKIADCGTIHQLVRATPSVSPHIPWDRVADVEALKEATAAEGLGFDAVNSNTFQDQAGQELSYKFGSLTHTDPDVRAQAIAHNIECIEIGRALGSKALTVWVGDGTNFPGQQPFIESLERYLDSMAKVYAALPDDWRVFLEHKHYEPAFYSTVIADWGTNYLCARELGPKAHCLVDLGHHAPNTNIEMIVARLIQFEKLGGFHFNDSKYGDDDLDSGAIDPFQLFLVMNELVDAEDQGRSGFDPAYMLDQSHNVTDPIESLMLSAMEVQHAYARALLVDRPALRAAQQNNDALLANRILKSAYETDVAPITATLRLRKGAAIDPLAAYRQSGYRKTKAAERPSAGGPSAGIV